MILLSSGGQTTPITGLDGSIQTLAQIALPRGALVTNVQGVVAAQLTTAHAGKYCRTWVEVSGGQEPQNGQQNILGLCSAILMHTATDYGQAAVAIHANFTPSFYVQGDLTLVYLRALWATNVSGWADFFISGLRI